MNVVREDALAVDLDDRDQLAVALLELGRAVDRNLLELEAQLLPQRPHLYECPLAEVATPRVEDPNLRDRALG
jgi:hypothetical protein